MENKLTPKQALQVLNRNLFDLSINPYAYKNFEEKNESFDIVEQALTELEEIKKVMPLNNEKAKKNEQILEVLKNKRVDVMRLCCSDLLVYYNEGGIYEELTQEEFDLLKEWLKQ